MDYSNTFSNHQNIVYELYLEEIEEGINNLQDYKKALVIFRFRDSLIGQWMFDVKNDRITYDELREVLPNFASCIWQKLMQNDFKPEKVHTSSTVVICTRDRPEHLKNCLKSLDPITSSKGIEAIVVDNCPSDDQAARIVANYPKIHYKLEPRPGLNAARNAGLKYARGEIVAFIDDDVIVDKLWLEMLLRNFKDPTVAVVTGMALPLELKTKAQQWFEHTNTFQRGFKKKIFDSRTMNPVSAGQVGAGVNMAIRKISLNRIGYFDEALDGGTITRSGGDQEFFYRTIARGYRIVYEPDSLVWHKHRESWESLCNTIYGYGVGLFAWWTRALIVEREFSLLRWAPSWFVKHHLGNLLRSFIRKPRRIPLDLALAEIKGAILGPACYFISRVNLKRAREINIITKQK